MEKKKKKSVIPLYGVGLTWLSRAIAGGLGSIGGWIGCAFLSLVVYGVLKLIFPDKEIDEGESSGQEQKTAEPRKQEKKAPEPEKTSENPELDAVMKQGREAVSEIQRLNDEIPDFKMSAEIKQLEILTDKIFDDVRQHPEDLREVRQFMDYYLPTTVQLLQRYVVLQNQGLRMGNIDDGMTRIEQMLEKVIVAFQKQLDSLFERDVVDITADIQVMEQMMASQGLTDQKDF